MVLSIRQQSDKAETLEEDEAPEQRETKGSIQVIERMMSLLDALAETAMAEMQSRRITSLFVVADDGRPLGLVHIHDFLRIGLV